MKSASRFARTAHLEPLENRKLMSGTWSTVDSSPLSTGIDGIGGMACDSAGNIYAVGAYNEGTAANSAVLREKASGSSSFVDVPVNPGPTGGYAEFNTVAVDPNGDLFVLADFSSTPVVLERPAGQSNFAAVSITLPSGSDSSLQLSPQSLTTDSAGDAFLTGWSNIAIGTTGRGANTRTLYGRYGIVWKMAAGQSSFRPIYDAPSSGFSPIAITSIDSGPSAGIYTIDDVSWQVEKSTNGGTAWTKVDSYNYDPNALHDTFAWALAGDSSGSGHLFVAGDGQQKVVTGTKTVKVNGKLVQQPVYGFVDHWVTRESTDGGATWSKVDDFALTQLPGNRNSPYDVADLNGTVYVAGQSTDSAGNDQGIVRTNASGTWQPSDNYAADWYSAVTIDPTTGTPYAGTGSSWTIRSGPAVTSTSAPVAFSSTHITASSLLSDGATSGDHDLQSLLA